MEQKADLHFVQPLLKMLKQFNSNKQCVCPSCSEPPIGSHVIAESVLKLLATQGEVLTWERSEDEIVVDTIRGDAWDHIHKEPKRVGIKNNVTYPIFCDKHDNNIFEALEKPGFSYEPRQVALLAYRALCYKTWNPNLEKKLEFFLSNKDDETALQWSRMLSLKTMLEARQKFYDMLEAGNYHQMRWRKIICPIDHCIACTDAIIPYAGDEDARRIASGNTTTTPEDVVTFTFFPEKRLNASICVITWFRDNMRGEEFKESFNRNVVSEVDLRNNIITNALRMSLVYTSQAWWDALTPEQRNNMFALRMSEPQFLNDLVENGVGNDTALATIPPSPPHSQ
jgi:L-rhamnose mutarotase